MEPARSIGKLGFRKWYERRLMESYAWLVSALLCAVLVGASLELLSFKQPFPVWLGNVGLMFVGVLIVGHGVRRFLNLLGEAQRLGDQSTCKQCRRDGAFSVIAESPRMRVRCRHCDHEWTFD